jgi:hypothetical protein
MTRAVVPTTSERHGFAFNKVPTIRGPVWGGGDLYPNDNGVEYVGTDYGRVLDCVYEMTDAVASANGITHEQAIEQVLRDERWRILPTHKQMILNKLK